MGSEVARTLLADADELASRAGAPLDLVGVAVRDTAEPLRVDLDPSLLTTDSAELVTRADIVVELIGGIEPARTLILSAIAHGASVVTANKALLAAHGPELYSAADEAGVDLYFEAAVAGAIPLLRPLRESLAGDRINRVIGIVNGTTNYVLDRMASDGLDFDDAVKKAQELGFAEAEPSADIEGFDAASKAAIIASIAFHSRIDLADVYREGITKITSADIAWAKQSGHVIKLLAITERVDGGVSVRVHPTLVPQDHPLASVKGAFNAVFVQAESAGDLMFYGAGAGGRPTSSAVLGDAVSAARHKVNSGRGPSESRYAELPVVPLDQITARFQIRLEVADEPGVLERVAGAIAAHRVSIQTVHQVADVAPARAELVITLHPAPEAALSGTVESLGGLESVHRVVSVLRVLGA